MYRIESIFFFSFSSFLPFFRYSIHSIRIQSSIKWVNISLWKKTISRRCNSAFSTRNFPFIIHPGSRRVRTTTGAHRVERRPRWQERDGFRLLDAFITPLVTSSGVGGTHDWIRSTLDSCYRVTPVEFSVRRRLVR